MIKCGWCGTNYVNWKTHCDSCGGPLPPLPGMTLGAAPPPAPRSVPRGFEFRQKYNIATLLGLGFMIVGSIIAAPAISAKSGFALIPLFFAMGGFFVCRYGWTHGKSVIQAFRNGVAVDGRVMEVLLDTTQSVNQRHPWKLKYAFVVDGHPYEGSLTSFDSTIGQRSKGQPLWVLYLPNDPEQCTIYPPIK